MGNQFEIAVQNPNKEWANLQIDRAIDEIKRIETLLTTFSADSITNQINANAGIKEVEVPDEVFQLISRCIKISKLTQGAFDISYGGFDKQFWNFDLKMKKLPSAENASQAVRLIDYRKIHLNENSKTVFLEKKGMRIGFGGISENIFSSVSVFPNPANETLNIRSSLDMFKGDVTIRLSNSAGQEVLKVTKNVDQELDYNIQLPNLEKGIYFLELGNEEFGTTKKIIIE